MSFNEYLRKKREDESQIAWKIFAFFAVITIAVTVADLIRAWVGTL